MRRTLFTFLSAIALVATGVVGAVAVGGSGVVDPPPRIAFLANGVVPADALAAGGIAGQLGAPLFTTSADALNDDARDGIADYDPDLVIVLGGPVAIDDSVLTALSRATGLPVVDGGAPTGGIMRVAGGDRFATARAVAGLLAAYDPAYLPVDATALGAVDADTLDGKHAAAFARSDQSCEDGQAVTGIDDAGAASCESFQTDGAFIESAGELLAYRPASGVLSFTYASTWTMVENWDSGSTATFVVPLHPTFPPGVANLELLDVTVCVAHGDTKIDRTIVSTAAMSAVYSQDDLAAPGYEDGTCTSLPLEDRHIVSTTVRPRMFITLDAGATASFGAITATWRPTSDEPILTL